MLFEAAEIYADILHV